MGKKKKEKNGPRRTWSLTPCMPRKKFANCTQYLMTTRHCDVTLKVLFCQMQLLRAVLIFPKFHRRDMSGKIFNFLLFP